MRPSHNRPGTASPRVLLASAFLIAFAAVATPPRPASADDPRPAKKDSRKQAQPREATLTTSVTPARARPGDTVTYRVTAKLAPSWHIYKYGKEPVEEGPRNTSFDFFDTAGLKPKGDWTPSEPPLQKKEPAFPEIPFLEFHEDEVTWSLQLAVPADATPGQKTLRCQAAYQICSDQSCSFPGQWTLPDATLTVLPAGAGGPGASATPPTDPAIALASAEAPAPAAPAASEAKPAKKDSRAAAKPKDVTLTTAIEPATAKPGDTVSFKVTAKVNPPWHIYKYGKVQPDTGPKLTSFDLFDTAGLTPKGEWEPSKPPIRKKDDAFKDLPFVEYYEDEVTWSIPLQVPADASPGSRTLRVQAGYMICAQVCSIPGQWTLPAATVTIEPGAGPAAAVAASAPATPAEPQATAPTVAAGPETLAATSSDGGGGEVGEPLDRKGLIPFLLLCASGGLLALAMPCVWPMIPVTVNFFVKQGQRKGSTGTTGLAIVYCLAIIGIFTGIGAMFSAFLGAGSLSNLANNPWLNFGVAGLFLVFGLSLLGLFEIRLPSFLLNASVQGESRGGLVGVMFMALTLTITSFTCTFPVVGALLVSMANGDYLYPILGMITFASVVALPFFLLALSPGLLAKMPRSGDWMNSVKVVGGLIEIGAALKFLNTAECAFVVPRDAWTNAPTVLAAWITLSLICGIYLLGLFKTDHDHGDAGVGPGRILFGWGFLALALFLAPALFGRPPQSKIWYTVVGLLPADAGDLKAELAGGERRSKDAISKDPAQAEREQVAFHGVEWGMSYDAALETAKASGKPVLIDFTGVNCANCRLMEQEVLPRPEVVSVLNEFVTIQLYTDFVPIPSITRQQRDELGDRNLGREIDLTQEATNPNYVVLDASGQVLGKMGGKRSPEEFVGFLKDALGKAKRTALAEPSGVGR